MFAVCIVALAGCKSTDDKPKPAPQSPKELRLRSRTVEIGEGIDRALAASLEAPLQSGETRHVMVQLSATLDPIGRADLEAAGVRLSGYLGSDTWIASLSDARALRFADAATVARAPALGAIRWMGAILPEDRVAPRLRKEGVPASARTPEGNAALLVYYFEAAGQAELRELLEQKGEIKAHLTGVHAFQVAVPETAIAALAAQDAVRWIEPVPPRGDHEASRARAFIQVDDAFAAGLEGDGIVVAILEGAHVRITHPDLTGHTFVGDSDTYDSALHPTSTAGIIAGSGAGGSQYRGMAPQATIYSYDFYTVTDVDPAAYLPNYLGDMRNAIDTRGASVLCNAWGTTGCSLLPYGEYSGLCDVLDAAVRGDGYERPAVIVYSAGNERAGYWADDAVQTDCITDTTTPWANYGTINHPKASKNTLSVGAVDSGNDKMTQYSSWGPTLDGRLKPEIVAGGHHNGTNQGDVTSFSVGSQGYQTALYNTNFPNADYGAHGMTSAAAAMVSGGIALLAEHYRETMRTPLDPLPSTIKALLIQTARDLSDTTSWFNPGPDYASGYGVVQIKDAIDLIGTGKHLEAKLLQGEEHSYTVQVGPSAASLKVTLAWDDPAAQPNAVSALVNDLDLQVIDPLGNVRHPWRLDPANPSAAAVRTPGADGINNVEQVLVDGGGLTAGTWTIRVMGTAVPEGPQRYSLVADRLLRGRIDAMAVLDRSGSMSGAASASMPDTKIEVLREAVHLFVDIMQADVGNRLGLVQFNSNVVALPSPPDPALLPLTAGRRADLHTVTIDSITAGGLTSIGDGLRAALGQFPAPAAGPATPRSILLVTDGKENQPEWIADVQQDLIDAGVGVYSLGLGYGSGVDEEKLTALSAATGATYRITSDHLFFRKLFLEALGGAADWSLIVDPIDVIGPGSVYTIPVQVSRDEHLITFAAYWEGVDEAISLQLITPSGRALQAKFPLRGVRYGSAGHYAFFQLDLPLGGTFASEWEGTWQMQLTGTARIPDGQQVRYSASALAEGGAKFKADFDRPVFATGDTVRMRARLTRAGRPLRGAKVVVIGDAPGAAIGTLLSDPKLDTDVTDLKGDPLNLADRKLHALLKAKPLPRDKVSFALHDDGEHGDGKPNDGVYGGTFDGTKLPGSYTFRFLAAGIPAGGAQTTTREWTGSFYVKLKVERKYSDCTVRALAKTAQGRSFRVSATPRDAYKNLLGPGHMAALAVVDGKNRRVVDLTDQGNGSYSGEVLVEQAELDGDLVLHVMVDGEQLARFEKPKGGTRK